MSNLSIIKKLGFSPKENVSGIFEKKYPHLEGYCIEIDFGHEKIDFGSLIKSENKSTQNFSQAENWVVLDCVDKLLQKGYAPQHITLEKTYPLGHNNSGRLDILVSRDNGKTYLMIECKTWGKEFDKAFHKLNKDGGQLFSYFQQDKNADILMLYASHFENEEVEYKNEIITIETEYRETATVKDFYDRWSKLTKQNGVFDAWVKPYKFQSKALRPELLKPITQEDSGFIFNRFLEILRHNVVSDKPNAFNKIFTLFLCKIYDEKTTPKNKELKFQWLEGQDNAISFQKRLTDLYREGMDAFLEKEVSDLSDTEFEKKYGRLETGMKKMLLEEFTNMRLKKNNEFAIKEVFDDDSFEENAIVVKEIVELLQGYKIRYTEKQQYLSDFFELLLTTGLKQESGQFFTPVPIAQFIIKSIPLDKLVKEKLKKGKRNDLLPTIMDYAAGSGHFLTESMHEIQTVINQIDEKGFISDTVRKIKSWKADHFDWAFDYVYGVEKDYRLVKVGKVGCYLHGDGLAKVIHSDGLGNFLKTKEYKAKLKQTDKDFPKENKQFDVVISNPPYSVSAFKNNARKYYTENDFDLYPYLTDQSSEIECLFIERTKQLLKDGGVAGIILPSSILTDAGIETKTRELILKYFEIIAITKLGSNTFMATGTNTVVLFLRRRNNYDCQNFKHSVNKIFDIQQDITVNGIENVLTKYLNHVWEGVSFEDYKTLMQKSPNQNITEQEIYQDYHKKIKAKNEEEHLQKIIDLEKEKLFYFVLAYPQKVVLVNTGEKKEEKRFLGYEFSNRRGSEGIHPTQRGRLIEECTSLFDAKEFENPEKASTYVYQAFQDNFEVAIHEDLKNNISRIKLIDLIQFDRAIFTCKISLSQRKKIDYHQVWKTASLKSIENIASIRKGKSITEAKTTKGDIPVVAGGKQAAYYHNQANREANIITVSASGAYSGFVNYWDMPIFASDCNTIKSKNENLITTKLIFMYLKVIQEQLYTLQRGQAQPHVYGDDLAKIKIPVPPREIQEKILQELSQLETKAQKIVIPNFEQEKENILRKYL